MKKFFQILTLIFCTSGFVGCAGGPFVIELETHSSGPRFEPRFIHHQVYVPPCPPPRSHHGHNSHHSRSGYSSYGTHGGYGSHGAVSHLNSGEQTAYQKGMAREQSRIQREQEKLAYEAGRNQARRGW